MKASPRKAKRLFRVWLERTLLLAGVAGIGIWVYSQVGPVVWDDWEGWVLDRQVAGQSADFVAYLQQREQEIVHSTAVWFGLARDYPKVASKPPAEAQPRRQRPPSIGPNGLIGRVSIPRLRLTAIVREGTAEKTLSLAAGHIPGTALPGVNGNVAIAGHRDTLFRGLRGIQKGDMIEFEALNGNFQYQVDSTEIVMPEDVGVLNPGPQPKLTLVTCYPFDYIGSAPKRFIVKASQVLQTKQDPGVWQEVSVQNEEVHKSGPRRMAFSIPVHHSRELISGISIGIDDVDTLEHSVYGWMWLMPERRTVWLRDRRAHDPLVFYSGSKRARRELTITSVTVNSVSGYLMMAD
jgi:sortase A